METKQKKGRKVHYFDYSLLAIVIFLMCFGLVMLYSTSSYDAQLSLGDSMYYLKRQGIFSVLGFGGMLFLARLDYHLFAKSAKLAYWGAMFAMFLVLTPLGVELNGARRWLAMPFDFTLQPSEITKIAVIVFIPLLICKMGKHIKKWYVLSHVIDGSTTYNIGDMYAGMTLSADMIQVELNEGVGNLTVNFASVQTTNHLQYLKPHDQ